MKTNTDDSMRHHAEDENTRGKGNKADTEDDGPACQSCRKKKAKCSRKQPCSHCVRFNIDCVYDDHKAKPGLRTGAIENLSQRVVALENMFLGQGVLWQQVWNCLNAVQAHTPPSECGTGGGSDSLKECTGRLRATLSTLSADPNSTGYVPPLQSPLKRRRKDDVEEQPRRAPTFHTETEYELPPEDLVDSLVEIYFANIHPWIPILHVRQFRERMAVPSQRTKLTSIFHAIVSLCVRFSPDSRLSDSDIRNTYAKRSRQTVILQSMESFSVENLQALVICAFDTIGSGRGPSAWSIVGSMTRTVEQLQLSVEDEDQPRAAELLIKRMAFLPPAMTWIEREERRRVFWNVFLMDRFCSIATGWNFSLTSADVKRRLPCEGALWEEGKALQTPTPYFGIADKSSGGGSLPTRRPELDDQASLGGFAFSIEALESLSLVTTFFLRHELDVSKVQEVQMWLMRFKELDLRLVQWKIFLPEQWREACARNVDGIMDPNLTLAHITHNTAVGLLHQGIAYPSPEWQVCPIRLPSVSSAETCMTAAKEVAIIAEEYLQDSIIPTSPQFAFCLFICGRMLLAHALHYNTSLPTEVNSLINSLQELSRRWNGPHISENHSNGSPNLASKFAARLAQARDQGPHALDIRQSAYSDEQSLSQEALPALLSQNNNFHNRQGNLSNDTRHTATNTNDITHGSLVNGQRVNGDSGAVLADQEGSPDSISLAFPPLPLAFQPHCANGVPTRTSSPIPNLAYQIPGNGEYGSTNTFADSNNGGYDLSGNGFDDLNSFFDYSFLPMQRISVFSGASEKPTEQEH